MNLNVWFDRGISKEQYIASQDKHREGFSHIYDTFQVPKNDESFLQEKRDFRIIILAEEWCGHCMLNIPILFKIAEVANIPVRILPRDSHLELMDHYLTNEKRYIPIFIFIDEDGNEIGKWGPMAPEIEQFVNREKENLPDRESPAYDEAFLQFIQVVGNTFKTDKTYWQYVYEDLKKALP